MSKLDLSRFKKVRSGEKHTVLRHPEGHEITIFHKALSKSIKDQLDKLEMAEGGNVKLQQAYKKPDINGALEANQRHLQFPKKYAQGGSVGHSPAEDAGLKENYQTAGFKMAKKRVNANMANEMKHFDDGGLVTKKPVVDAIRTAAGGQPIPSPTQAPPQYTPEQEAKRKATRESYGYAEGGQAIEGPETPVTASRLESQYGPEEDAAQASMDATPSVQISDEASAPITPPNQDMSHSHLSEALKNLSSKYSNATPVKDTPATDHTAIGEQQTSPQVPQSATMGQSPQGNSQGTLPEQAQANVAQANQAEMSAAKNTQASMGQEAAIHGKEAEQMQQLHAKYEEIGNNLHQKFENTAADVEKGKVDPNRWWASQGTGSKVLTAIGMLFAGAAGGAIGHPEMANEIINKAIDRDIDAQKLNLQNKNSLLGKYMDMYQSLPQAEAAARLTLSAGIEGLVKQQAAKLGSANAINTALQANAQRRQALLPQMEGLAKGQVMGQMYNQMAQPQQQSGNQEQAYQDQMQRMRVLNPDLGKDMENKYLPNVGIARVPITDALREKMAAQKDLSTKLARLELFAQQHQGTTLDRETVNVGKTMAADAQQAARVAGHQGVYKESDQKFLENMIDSDPTKFAASIRTIPKYKTLRQQNDATLKTLYKSYGVKPFFGSNESQLGEQPASSPTPQTATMGGKQYRKVPGGWEPMK